MRRMIGLALTLALGAAVGTPGAGAHPADRRDYVAGVEVYIVCNREVLGQNVPGYEVGGACFNAVPSDARAVTITITDATGKKIGASWAFRAPGSGTDISSGELCGSKRVLVPGGGEKRLLIWLHPATGPALDCPDPSTAGPPTTGSVVAAWSHTI